MPGDGDGQRADRRLSGGSRIPISEIVELASRSSGPGGQHVNTSSTRVSLRWNIRESEGLSEEVRELLLRKLRARVSRLGVLIVHSDRSRSRQRNLEAAYERLYELVESALRQAPPRKPTAPTRGSKKRRLEAKRQRGEVKTQRRIPRDHES